MYSRNHLISLHLTLFPKTSAQCTHFTGLQFALVCDEGPSNTSTRCNISNGDNPPLPEITCSRLQQPRTWEKGIIVAMCVCLDFQDY